MKRSFACLVFALLLLLAGCGEAVESSEVFAFPEPTTQIKVKRVTSWGEETEFMFGPDVYDPENREVVPVIQWFYALELEKAHSPKTWTEMCVMSFMWTASTPSGTTTAAARRILWRRRTGTG